MFQKLLLKQKQLLDEFFNSLDLVSCETLVQKILNCKGVLHFTGVGKSGFIAGKIASTLTSSGTNASFLSPMDALHGDLGRVAQNDLVLILSKSGETEELIELIPFIHNKNASVIALTSNRASRLAKRADFSIYLPFSEELCPFDLVPTISTEVQLLFGDLLSIAVMEAKGFTLDQLAQNHPGGRIGKRSTMRVNEFMLPSESTPICHAEDKLEHVLENLSKKRCGCLIVIDHQKSLKGIFTDGDLRRALQEKGEKVLQESVGLLMTHAPKSIDVKALAWDAMKLMEADKEHPVMVLPVLDEQQKVVGIVKMHDLVQAGL